MTVVGEASILITPDMAVFGPRLEAESQGAFGKFGKDAEKHGQLAGANLRKGVTSETGRLGDDLEKEGTRGGARYSKGMSGGLSKLTGLISNTGVPLGNLGAGLDKSASAAERAGKSTGSFAESLGGAAGPLAAVGVAAIAGAGYAIHLGEGMETADAKIAGAAGTSVDAAKKIGSAFLDTAGKSTFSGEEMAKAFASVAGQLKATEGHALGAGEATKVMTAASDLAEAKQIELGSATEVVSKVMQAFQMHSGEAAHATDVLFSASNATGQSVEALGNQLAKARSKLGETGGSVGELSSLLVDMTEHGITGRASMAALNTATTTLTKAISTTSKAGKEHAQMLQELGLHVFDARGTFVGMGAIIDQLAPKFAKMTQQEQLATAATIFGSGAARQMTAVIDAGSGAYNKATQTVEKHGTAQAAARKQSETLHGEMKTLSATFQDVATKIGLTLIPIVTTLLGAFLKLMQGVGTVVSFIKAHWEALSPVLLGFLAPIALIIAHFKDLEHAASSVAHWISGTWHEVESTTSHLIDSIAGFFTSLPGRILGALESIANWFKALPGHILGDLAALPGDMLHLGEKIGEELVHGVEKFAEKIVNVITNPIEEAASIVEGIFSGGGGGKSGGGAGGVSGASTAGGVEGQIVNFFLSKGFSPNAAAGIAGNVAQESSFNPNEPGGGLFQYEKGRGGAAGQPGASVKTQLEQAYNELRGPFHNVFTEIQKAKSPQEAARIFSQQFEKPSEPNLPHREQAAAEAKVHTQATGKDTAALTEHTKALGESTKHHTAAHHAVKKTLEAYVEPFLHATGVHRSRTDQGVDFTFGGALGAIGPGIITAVHNFQGFGETLVEKLTAGKEKGQYIYTGLETGGKGVVHAGQAVRAGQEIARGYGTGGIEMGFAHSEGLPITRYAPGQSHNIPTAGGELFSKFLATLGKGGSELSAASLAFTQHSKEMAAAAKAELKKQTADKKAGESEKNKLEAAIASGGVKELSKLVGGAHEKGIKSIEKTLAGDHTSALTKLRGELVKVHKEAMEALRKALEKQAEKEHAEHLKAEDVVNKERAETEATQIADATKVALDRSAQQGLTGAELGVAVAQTHIDWIKQVQDELVGAAKIAVDQSKGHGELAEATAEHALTNAEDVAKVEEARAQSQLDYATNAASEATKAQTKATEKQTKATEEATAAAEAAKKAAENAPQKPMIFNITGTSISGAEAIREIGWALKVGALPAAVPQPVHA